MPRREISLVSWVVESFSDITSNAIPAMTALIIIDNEVIRFVLSAGALRPRLEINHLMYYVQALTLLPEL